MIPKKKKKKRWKQLKHPLAEEWIHKMWSTQATEYYSAIKRSEVQIHMRTWMNLESIMISERSQMLRGHILYDCILIKCPEEANPQTQEVD